MTRAASHPPIGHGELLTTPAYEEWAGLARANARDAAGWDFDLCGVPVREVRAMARREAIARGRTFSSRMGVAIREVPDEPSLLIVTGHQPEFYHPGVWLKDFLLQRLADETGAAALDIVVDSDGFDVLEIHSPCLGPDVKVCRAYLAVGTSDGCYACTPVPSDPQLEQFGAAAAEHLETLPAPAIGRHFARFRECLRAAAPDARDIAELVTFARRRYEEPAGSDYLELPVTSMAGSRAFATMLAHFALDANGFARAYNEALGEYRQRTGTRSSAQPFPDLGIESDLVELPFWDLGDGRRQLMVRTGARPALMVAGEVLCELDRDGDAAAAILGSRLRPAPKALALTLYCRLLVADLFVHGVGGGRYDQVTDAFIESYFGVRPPRFVVASLTMYLPLGGHIVSDAEIEEVSMALNRLKHNPDQMLGEVEFETFEDSERARDLVKRKAGLVAAIAGPDADKKTLGRGIRDVNGELAAMLAPIERQLQDDLAALRQMRDATGILTDRTYPFAFWDPAEVADKAR